MEMNDYIATIMITRYNFIHNVSICSPKKDKRERLQVFSGRAWPLPEAILFLADKK